MQRYACALVCAGYFFKCLALMAIAVAAKTDKNSLISNKWAAEARCQVCNGILQRSAVPTGACVHPNPITYPDSTHFPITGGGKSHAQANWSLLVWDIQRVWLVGGGSILGVVRVKLCMAGPKVWNQKCVLLLGLFHLVAQRVLERGKGKGTEDWNSTFFTWTFRLTSAFGLWSFSVLIFRLMQAFSLDLYISLYVLFTVTIQQHCRF